jgi:polygalacturonase
VFNFSEEGGVASKNDIETEWANGRLMNQTFSQLEPGDTFLIPNETYSVMGGIFAHNLENVTIQLDGTLSFSRNIKHWPLKDGGRVLECLHFVNTTNLIITSSGTGTLEGNGAVWWGFPFIGYLIRLENRPKIMKITNASNTLVENIHFRNSPYWTFLGNPVYGLEIRNSHINNRRDQTDKHSLYNLSAFNTDGFDIYGSDVWIHDCEVWTQDDAFAVKGNSSNILIERVKASGLGLTIGSIHHATVRNVTFRDAFMLNTVKGIYMKFAATGGLIKDITYENVVMESPTQAAIWIGPAQ